MISIEQKIQEIDPSAITQQIKDMLGKEGKALETNGWIISSKGPEDKVNKIYSAEGTASIEQTPDNYIERTLFGRLSRSLDYIRPPDFPEEVMKINRAMREVLTFSRYGSVCVPSMEFCQKHSLNIVRCSDARELTYAFILPLCYHPITLSGVKIVHPSMPRKDLKILIPFHSVLKNEDGNNNGYDLRFAYVIHWDGIRIITAGGTRNFRIYNSYYSRGQMRVNFGDSPFGSDLRDVTQIVNLRDQMQEFLNDVKPNLVFGVPRGFPVISSIVASDEPIVSSRDEETASLYISSQIDLGDDIESFTL